ncbi:MAG: hypothetical protein JWP34_2521 [Massilia sp.]|nr:hypothetical protein [Massilia sp.]
MITHALTIIVNELTRHLAVYGPSALPPVELGNIAEGFRTTNDGSGVSREVLDLSVVNIKEEKTLKNQPNFVRDMATNTARYENPPVILNFQVLLVATHVNYSGALLMLSRAIRFFQSTPLFTETTVAPASITHNAPLNMLDRLVGFRLALDLYSPTMEEVNHLWGTLGGKQYPFVLYMMRALDLRFHEVQAEQALILDVVRNFKHKSPAAP